MSQRHRELPGARRGRRDPHLSPQRDCGPAHTWTLDLWPLAMGQNSCYSGQSLSPSPALSCPFPSGTSSVSVQSMSHVPHGAF